MAMLRELDHFTREKGYEAIVDGDQKVILVQKGIDITRSFVLLWNKRSIKEAASGAKAS
jgi:hypothetical protein